MKNLILPVVAGLVLIGCKPANQDAPQATTPITPLQPASSAQTTPPPTTQEPETQTTQEMKLTHVDAQQASKLLKDQPNVVVLDVRTPTEYAEGHINGSQNIDFKAADFSENLAKLDKDTPYLIHCRSGGRSTQSLKAFEELGFKHIIHLDGGMLGWQEAQLEVEK